MSIFACPVCGEQLAKRENIYFCPNGHSYDIAAEGYAYLLKPNQKHSKDPGDNKQMTTARRRFLESGYYNIFSDKLNEITLKYIGSHPVILDAGCGEGYYTGRLREYLVKNNASPSVYAFDISKSAVKAAAKRYKNISFAVGSMFEIPVLSAAADYTVNVFAPIVPAELNRVLKPGGFLVIAVPGERHLFGLKEILYDKPYENEHRETQYPGFTFIDRVQVRDEISISGASGIQDLFTMTPYCWKTPKEGGERLKRLDFLKTEIGFDFLVYQKVG